MADDFDFNPFDLETRRNFWTDEVFRLYGLQPGACEPSFEAWLATVHPDDREAAAAAAIVVILLVVLLGLMSRKPALIPRGR